jgi:hypothetical protein
MVGYRYLIERNIYRTAIKPRLKILIENPGVQLIIQRNLLKLNHLEMLSEGVGKLVEVFNIRKSNMVISLSFPSLI